MCAHIIPQNFDTRTQYTTFASLEIHVVPKASGDKESLPKYRVFLHTGRLEKKDAMVSSLYNSLYHVDLMLLLCSWERLASVSVAMLAQLLMWSMSTASSTTSSLGHPTT